MLVVDSEFKELVPGILQQIQSVSDKPIKYLVNTHHHGDHTGGNEGFRPFAVILAHENVRKRMLASPQTILKEYPAYLEDAKKKGNAEDIKFLEDAIAWAKKVKVEEIAAPVVTFDSEVRVHVGDETIDVWHTPPAHTDGDSVIYFEKAKVLHMGDVFFHRIVPFIDVSAGGSAKGYLASIDAVVARVAADVKIIPGHGEATDLAGLKEARAVHRGHPRRGAAGARGRKDEGAVPRLGRPAEVQVVRRLRGPVQGELRGRLGRRRSLRGPLRLCVRSTSCRRRLLRVPASATRSLRACAGEAGRRTAKGTRCSSSTGSSRPPRCGSTSSPPPAAGGPGIAVDLPGFGASDRPWPYDYGVEAEAASLERFMDARAIGRAVLVGNSLGGAATMLLAATRPKRVEALILVDAASAHTPIPWPVAVLRTPVLGELALALTTRGDGEDRTKAARVRANLERDA